MVLLGTICCIHVGGELLQLMLPDVCQMYRVYVYVIMLVKVLFLWEWGEERVESNRCHILVCFYGRNYFLHKEESF